MMQSPWQTIEPPQHSEPLSGTVKTDVLIVGGGMTGILCARYLADAGVSCAVAEGGRLGSGTTLRTTAKITSQHGLLYHRLLRSVGAEKTKMVLSANEAALAEYKRICKSIDCDFESKSAFLYSLTDRAKIEKEAVALRKLGIDAVFHETTALPFPIACALEWKEQAQFHPIKFLHRMAEGLTVYENTFVRRIENGIAYTNRGAIHAKNIIIATHFPFINTHGVYFMKLHQSRSYVTAFENAPDYNGMYIDISGKGLSFRNSGNLLFVGGGAHRTGKSGACFGDIDAFAKHYLPKAQAKYRWAAQDCMSLDGIPYIGQYSKSTPHLYVATGYSKWGMTSAMAAALILRDLILHGQSEFAPAFDPSRLPSPLPLMGNGLQFAASMLTPKAKRCSHLGCALKWNRLEHTWDCPCHGSRFTEDGVVLENPAVKACKQRP